VFLLDVLVWKGEVFLEFLPSNPKRFPRRLLDFVVGPPMENPGLRDNGFPDQTVPITAKIVARSTPIP
jgi:hypothetical protein